jgi:hypothetical protein
MSNSTIVVYVQKMKYWVLQRDEVKADSVNVGVEIEEKGSKPKRKRLS